MNESALLEAFYHEASYSWSYVVADSVSRQAMIVDPVLDYEPHGGIVGHDLAQRVVDFVEREDLKVRWIVETHAHADHLTAANWLRQRFEAEVGVGEGIVKVQQAFNRLYNLHPPAEADAFDRLFASHDHFALGSFTVTVMHTPGHTNDSVTYLVGDMAFIGDTLFAPDYGSARCDFPGGDAARLYDSIQRLYALPEQTRLLLCHDYPPPSRGPRYCYTVAEQKSDNVHLNAETPREAFIAMRRERDQTLAPPRLILPAVQVNIRAGRLPEPEANGTRYLKIPLNKL